MERGYSFEDYIWHRGTVLGQNVEAWHAARPTATAIFDSEDQELMAAEINAREIARGLSPLTSMQPRIIRQQGPIDPAIEQQSEPAHYVLTPGIIQPEATTDVVEDVGMTDDHQSQTHPSANEQQTLMSYTAVEGVSALTNRPLHLPVKVYNTRNRKSVNYATTDIEAPEQDNPESQPAAKRAKTTRKAAPKSSGTKALKAAMKPASKAAQRKKKPVEPDTLESAQEARSEPSEAAKTPTADAAQPETRTKQTRSIATKTPCAAPDSTDRAVKLPPSVLLDPFFESVINGDQLPIHRDQAMQAFAERKRRKREEYEARPAFQKEKAAAEKARTTKKSKTPATPYVADMMPEFFEPANFTKGVDPARCVCGMSDDADYEGIWVGCDTKSCGVWQHSDCMGDAVPENIKGSPYFCHNCDPWGHRVLIQRLRKGETIVNKG